MGEPRASADHLDIVVYEWTLPLPGACSAAQPWPSLAGSRYTGQRRLGQKMDDRENALPRTFFFLIFFSFLNLFPPFPFVFAPLPGGRLSTRGGHRAAALRDSRAQPAAPSRSSLSLFYFLFF